MKLEEIMLSAEKIVNLLKAKNPGGTFWNDEGYIYSTIELDKLKLPKWLKFDDTEGGKNYLVRPIGEKIFQRWNILHTTRFTPYGVKSKRFAEDHSGRY